MPLTRHTISGVVAEVPQHLIDHDFLGRFLELVPEGTKSLAPGLHLEGTVAERTAATAVARHVDTHKKDRK